MIPPVFNLQVKLYLLISRASKGGVQVTEEEATEQYQKLMAGDKKAKGDGGHSDQGAPLTRAAGGSAVGTANVTHKDNENIVVLSFLRDLLKCAALFPLFLVSIYPRFWFHLPGVPDFEYGNSSREQRRLSRITQQLPQAWAKQA